MLEELKETWKKIQQDSPGKRFCRQYRRRQSERKSVAKKTTFIVVGIIVVIIGIIMLPAPGPGMLVIFMGLGIISQESLLIAILLDKLEIRIRKLVRWSRMKWKKSSTIIKGLIVVTTFLLSAAALYGAFMYFQIHYNWP